MRASRRGYRNLDIFHLSFIGLGFESTAANVNLNDRHELTKLTHVDFLRQKLDL